ncbi:T9SS type A sorting domain-containing protein [Chitinophagaceae bacterium LWZ2-11]
MKKFYFLLLLFIALNIGWKTDNYGYSDDPIKITRFYPNPATSIINFEFQPGMEKGYTLQIYNFMGKKLSEQPVADTKITISLESFYRGLYIFQLRDRTGNIIESGKFQVIK